MYIILHGFQSILVGDFIPKKFQPNPYKLLLSAESKPKRDKTSLLTPTKAKNKQKLFWGNIISPNSF